MHLVITGNGKNVGRRRHSNVMSWKWVHTAIFPFRRMQGNFKKSWILDSTPWIPDSLSVELGFRIAIFSGIPDSLSCIPDCKAQNSRFHKTNFQDSGFHKQKCPGFQNRHSHTCGHSIGNRYDCGLVACLTCTIWPNTFCRSMNHREENPRESDFFYWLKKELW